MGNILQGLALNEAGVFTGTFLGLLTPFALFCGITGLSLFTLHGASYLCLKTSGDQLQIMRKWAKYCWGVSALLIISALIWSFLMNSYFLLPAFREKAFTWLGFICTCSGLVCFPLFLKKQSFKSSFASSAAIITGLVIMCFSGIFPRIVPAAGGDMQLSLLINEASSSPLTLKVMLIIALIGMPVVLCYTAVIYFIFKGKTVISEDSY